MTDADAGLVTCTRRPSAWRPLHDRVPTGPDGMLPARKVGGTWWIDPADLDRPVTTAGQARGRRSAGEPDDASAW